MAQDSLDVEVALHDDQLDIGVFGTLQVDGQAEAIVDLLRAELMKAEQM